MRTSGVGGVGDVGDAGQVRVVRGPSDPSGQGSSTDAVTCKETKQSAASRETREAQYLRNALRNTAAKGGRSSRALSLREWEAGAVIMRVHLVMSQITQTVSEISRPDL